MTTLSLTAPCLRAIVDLTALHPDGRARVRHLDGDCHEVLVGHRQFQVDDAGGVWEIVFEPVTRRMRQVAL